MLKKCSNEGYTIVELIIVVVILGIISATSFLGIQSFLSMDVDYGMSILQATLDETRYDSMARGEDSVSCEIKLNGNSYYAVVRSEEDKLQKLHSARYPLSFVVGDVPYEIDETSSIVIQFNKSDGSIKLVSFGGSPLALSPDSNYFYSNDVVLSLSRVTGRSTLE